MGIGIYGAGNIGSEIYREALRKGHSVSFIKKSDGFYEDLEYKVEDSKIDKVLENVEKANPIFVAIPTKDDGKIEYDIIKSHVEKEKIVITSAKGALSNYFTELKPYLHLIGYRATVGGGTGMLHYLQREIKSNPEFKEIHGIINASLNYYLYRKNVMSSEEALQECIKYRYAEPGASSVLKFINNESCSDIPMKSAILFNLSGISEQIIEARNIRPSEISKADLKKLESESRETKYIVSITRKECRDKRIGGFQYKAGEWYITGGFRRIDKGGLFRFFKLAEYENNSLIIHRENRTEQLIGAGAGPYPTVYSMFKDAKALLKENKPLILNN